MPKFIYTAKKSPTESIEGTIEAESLDKAIDGVIKLGLVPLDVAVAKNEEGQKSVKLTSPSFRFLGAVQLADVSIWMRNISDLVAAKVPILRALEVTAKQIKNPHFKKIISEMQTFVQDGGTLSSAMGQFPQVFPSLAVYLTRSGELGGNLEEVLKRLSAFMEKDIEIQSKVKASLVYPALVFAVGCLTVFVLLTFVVPRIMVMFNDLMESLPLPTLILMGLSNFFVRFWWLMIALLTGAFFYFKNLQKSSEGRARIDHVKLKMPFWGKFILEAEMARFARSLGTLLEGGVTIVTALESLSGILTNEVLRKEIAQAAEDVRGGASLASALKKCAYFSESSVDMIAIGEESGYLEETLLRLAETSERNSDRSIKVVISLLEPIMIFGVGLIVFFIVLAVMLPILKINETIR